jgi:hypothetical protein
VAHWQTVRATVRRDGTWENLDAYFLLGLGAATDARRRAEPIYHQMIGVLDDMLSDPDLSAARPLISELHSTIQTWFEGFLLRCQHRGTELYRATRGVSDTDENDSSESSVWDLCRRQAGRGYREKVGGQLQTWFNDNEDVQHLLTQSVERAWQSEFASPIAAAISDVPKVTA